MFEFATTPDTGATRSVIAWKICKKNKINLSNSKVSLFTANKEVKMDCSGSVKLQIHNTDVIIDAVVSRDLTDDILISWHDLKALGVISSGFPTIQEFPVHVNVVESKDDVKLLVDALKNEFSDILGDTLEPGEVLAGPPMKIHLKRGVKIHPVHDAMFDTRVTLYLLIHHIHTYSH